MGWWSDPVGSKPKGRSTKAKSTPDRGKVVATTKPGKAAAPAKCVACGKASCKCSEVGEAIPTRRGTPKDRIDADGRIWCPCGGLTYKGVCMDINCSTR